MLLSGCFEQLQVSATTGELTETRVSASSNRDLDGVYAAVRGKRFCGGTITRPFQPYCDHIEFTVSMVLIKFEILQPTPLE